MIFSFVATAWLAAFVNASGCWTGQSILFDAAGNESGPHPVTICRSATTDGGVALAEITAGPAGAQSTVWNAATVQEDGDVEEAVVRPGSVRRLVSEVASFEQTGPTAWQLVLLQDGATHQGPDKRVVISRSDADWKVESYQRRAGTNEAYRLVNRTRLTLQAD